MAENDWLNKNFGSPYEDPNQTRDGVSYTTDLPLAFGSRLAGLGADLGSFVRYLGEQTVDPEEKSGRATMYLGELINTIFEGPEEGMRNAMSPAAQKALEATVSDPNFWTVAGMALNLANMGPDVAAGAVLGMASGGVIPAIALTAVQGGIVSGGSVADDLYEIAEGMSDEELQEQVPFYKELREKGVDEEDARIAWNQKYLANKPAITAIVNGAANSIGPAAQAARIFSGAGVRAATGSTGRRIATGFLEGAASEAVQEGVEAGAVQSGEIEHGLREGYDYDQIAEAMATGAALGGAVGGGLGAVGGRERPSASRDKALPAEALGVDTAEEMPATSPTAPNQPGGAAPTTGPEPTPAAGATAPTTSQAATPSVEPAVPSEGITVVQATGPDPAQAVAIAAETSSPPPAPEVDIAPPVTPEVTQQGNVPPSQEMEVRTPVKAAPVESATVGAEAAVRPPVAEPAPSPVEPTRTEPPAAVSAQPQPTGPRILEARDGPDYRAQWDQRVGENIAQSEAPIETAPVGRNRTRAELDQRAATREGALDIATRFPPREEEMGLLSRKPQEVQAARALMLDRAKSMSDEANRMGITLPRAFRDSASEEANYNPETLLVMEARRLATKRNPSPADFRRFFDRELSVRTGDAAQAVAERRAEGDQAMRQGQDTTIDRVTDAEVPADNRTPEDILIEAEEEAETPRPRSQAKKPETKPERKAETKRSEELPPRIQKAIDDAIVAGAAKRQPEVVVKPKRIIRKPETKPEAREAAPRIREVQERIASARENTNTNPTEAQKVAGNYKKGSASINGMTVRIENPKGSVRTGTDARGRKWSTKLAHDYGYIEGTRGADGDPIDVYLGDTHDAPYVYVVDQMDADTKVFDEHKVMMGFKDDVAAFKAYERGFSDGRALDRMGGMRSMTTAEFRKWLDTDPKERASLSDQDLSEVRAFLIEEAIAPSLPRRVTNEAPAVVPVGTVVDPYSGQVVRPVSTQSASAIMDTFNLSDLDPFQRAIAGQARRMLSNLVGDTPVHFVSNADMARLTGQEGVKGVYSSSPDGQNAIFIRSDVMGRPDELRHAVLHEAVHAATIREVLSNKEIEGNIRDVMASTMQALEDLQVLDTGALDYALSDPTEFVSEVLSNPRVQVALSQMRAPDALVQKLGLARGRIRSAWDALVHTIRRALKMPETSTSMLEAALRVTEPAMAPRLYRGEGGHSFLIDGNINALKKSIVDRTNTLLERPELQASSGKPWLYRLRTMDSLSRAADRLFGGADSNPFRKLARLIEAQRVRATKHYEDATPLLQKTLELQNTYSKVRGENGQSVWENFTGLTLDETMAGVFADRPLSDQKHITAGPRDAWMRKQHPELSRRYNLLPEELKRHRADMLAYFKDQQQKLSMGIIKNRLSKLYDLSAAEGGVEGIASRVFNKQVTEADKAIIGEDYEALRAAGVLSKIDGPYFPLMRRGNWVVVGRMEVTPPGNARTIAPNEFEFTDVSEAEKFASSQAGRPTLVTVYVDPKTGETFGVEDGKQVRLTADDLNAEKRYRVTVQTKNVEMFTTEKEARARAAELAASGMKVDDVVPRNFDNYGAQAEALSPQIMRMMNTLEKRADVRNFTPEQKSEMMQTFSEMSLQMMASTRIQTRSLPRRNVAGASKDLSMNIHEYALATGNHLSKLEIAPQIDAEMLKIKEYIDTHRNDGMNGARQALYNEAAQRITQSDPRTEGGFTGVVNRVLAVSFIDKLMSPSYSVINATQPMMITTPYLAANYGVGRAWSAMSKAYTDIGSMRTIMQGFRDTMAKAKGNNAVPTDPVSLIMQRLPKKAERQMLEYMIEWGALDTDAGLEVSKIMQERRGLVGKLDGGIGYLEGIARQMPKAVEAINRSVSALAAYRLEMDRSGDHTKAVQFAYDTINRTQFNYSHTNANRLLNHPMLRIATQFKKYGIGMYQYLGEQAGIAINSASTPQERAAAIKALSYTIGMHVAVAGAMGLPTEPIKLIVVSANALGITDWTWSDVENGQREAMAGLFGKDIGEALSRGIPRLAGVDLSTRMGIDTLIGPFGEPRSNEAQDFKAYMWDTFSGAPIGLASDWTRGIGNLASGDIVRGLERLVPIKLFSDSLKAYRQMTEGSVSERTGKQVASPYSIAEAALRSIGFTPAREAEAFERSNMFYSNRDKQEEARRDLQRQWSEASGAARGRIWREIQAWNKKQPSEVRISLSDLRKYKRRAEQDMKNTREGLRAKRREQHLLNRADQIYSFEP